MSKYVYVMQTTLNFISTRQVDVYGEFDTAHENMMRKAAKVRGNLCNTSDHQVLVRTVGNSSILLVDAETCETLASFSISQNSVL